MVERFNAANAPNNPYDALNASIHKFIDANNKKTPQETLVNRIVGRIRETLKPEAKQAKHTELAGRIQDIHFNVSRVLQNLKDMKADLYAELDPHLVDAIIDPLITQIGRSVNDVQNAGQYTKWIEKAKLFSHLCSTSKERNDFASAIVHYTFEEFCSCIDKDLQILRDYASHELARVPGHEKKKNRIKLEIESKIESLLTSLLSLKEKAPENSLDGLKTWQENADKRRVKYYNSILEAIDTTIGKYVPNVHLEEEYEHFLEILDQLAFLEAEVPVVCRTISEAQSKDDYSSSITVDRLRQLEEEIKKLYMDIRMPPKVVEELEKLNEQLAGAIQKHKELNQ